MVDADVVASSLYVQPGNREVLLEGCATRSKVQSYPLVLLWASCQSMRSRRLRLGATACNRHWKGARKRDSKMIGVAWQATQLCIAVTTPYV
ncbi:hypothetical protein R1flu_008996 [Riccia fluitans]|uniref:Uncharacterized protein n=1 Tax=Riccia fluitans TaxID=41844 RepID=A0ABD1Z200_9MARC